MVTSVLSDGASQERREAMVSSDADRAASISCVLPFLAFGCKETALIMMMMKMMFALITIRLIVMISH